MVKIGDLVTPIEDMFISARDSRYNAWNNGDIGLVIGVGQFQHDDGFVYVAFGGGSGWVLDDEILNIEH